MAFGAPDFDIAIVGLGVRIPGQITIEAIEVLKACKRGYFAALDDPAIAAFEVAIAPYLAPDQSLPKLTSLTATYKEDRHRRESYFEACETVLDALSEVRPVAYLTPGNPMVADRVAQEILEGARISGYRVTVVPGISSMDAVLADLHQEMAPGMQVYEASWFVGANFKPDTRVSCLLMQLSLFGTSFPVIGRRLPSSNALAELRDNLLEFYSENHIVALIQSAGAPGELTRIYQTKLGDLTEVPANAQLGSSMFIPPATQPHLKPSFLERMTSVKNLRIMYPEDDSSAR